MGKDNQAKRKAKKQRKVAKEKRAVGRRQLKVIGKRGCDGCTECCSVLGVKPIEKPPWVSCEHLCEQGCGIYEERPPICGEFNCLWQMGLGDMADRPDKLGVVFAPTDGPFPYTGVEEIQAYEARPGALKDPKVMAICKKLVKNGALIIGIPYGTSGTYRFMGPKEKVMAAKTGVEVAKQLMGKAAPPE
jgi:hypothetical protein